MIEPETALRGAQLLSTAMGEMVEDEHDEMVTVLPGPEPALLRAERLETLGRDMAVLAQAMRVLLARSGEVQP